MFSQCFTVMVLTIVALDSASMVHNKIWGPHTSDTDFTVESVAPLVTNLGMYVRIWSKAGSDGGGDNDVNGDVCNNSLDSVPKRPGLGQKPACT